MQALASQPVAIFLTLWLYIQRKGYSLVNFVFYKLQHSINLLNNLLEMEIE